MLNGPSYALINGESFMEKNVTPLPELGQGVEWKTGDGQLPSGPGQGQSGTKVRKGSHWGRQNRGESSQTVVISLTKQIKIMQFNNKSSTIQKTKHSSK